ncbi:DUF899 family protein [Bacillus sp. FJAT-27245]|uniref:DUF899 family protein n=1 Tax=Bacillus sp. FJAT-27245 TaxID=1684144 RepID=UPI0006A778BA|nr:DUF899 family protein [Bacillus sp. FJAT-27245]
MSITIVQAQIEELQNEIIEKKKQLNELKKSVPEKLVENYMFQVSNGCTTSLLELFGDKNELIVVHNMGKGCSYCTMWADGLNGVFHHLIAKAGFVVSSPDAPEIQEDFAASRKWQFQMVSIKGSTFAEDMGFQKGKYVYPGVSTFRKDEENNIYLIAQAPFGPGDDFCVTWPLFELLPSGSEGVVAKQNLNNRSPFQLTNNIAIGVKDYDQAVQFYETIIGKEKKQTSAGETLFSISGTNIFIEEHEHNNTYFEFAVDDFEPSKKILVENGCVITKEYSDKSVMLADPYGLKFHLFEMKK